LLHCGLYTAAIVVLVLGWVYRKPIQGRIEQGGVKLRRGGTSVEIQSTPESTQPPASKATAGEESAPGEEDGASPPDDSSVLLEQTEREAPGEVADEDGRSPSFTDVVKLLKDGQAEEARRAFRELEDVRGAADETTRQRQDVLFAYWWYEFGRDPRAVSELKTLAEDERVRSLALRLIGTTKRDAGLFEEALAILEEAVDAAQTDLDKAEATIATAKCLSAMDRKSEAVERLTGAVVAAPDVHKRSLFDALADIYRDAGDWLLRAMALEKKLEVAPNDAPLRFAIGYAYAQAERNDLALLH
jgi:hypothetical protein